MLNDMKIIIEDKLKAEAEAKRARQACENLREEVKRIAAEKAELEESEVEKRANLQKKLVSTDNKTSAVHNDFVCRNEKILFRGLAFCEHDCSMTQLERRCENAAFSSEFFCLQDEREKRLEREKEKVQELQEKNEKTEAELRRMQSLVEEYEEVTAKLRSDLVSQLGHVFDESVQQKICVCGAFLRCCACLCEDTYPDQTFQGVCEVAARFAVQ